MRCGRTAKEESHTERHQVGCLLRRRSLARELHRVSRVNVHRTMLIYLICVFGCADLGVQPALAGSDSNELSIHTTNEFATDPFEPPLKWRLSEDVESLIVERFGSPLDRKTQSAYSRNPYIELEESVLMYPDFRFVLVGEKGADIRRLRRIEVFGSELVLRHSVQVGTSRRALVKALQIENDSLSCSSPIVINADYEEYDEYHDFSNRIHSLFEAHVGQGTVRFMRWYFYQD